MPFSKSMAHRYLLASFLSGNVAAVREFDAYCDDLAVTKNCLLKLSEKCNEIDCRESGTSFRLLMAVLPALGIEARISIGDSLAKRPIDELVSELINHGAKISKLDKNTYQVCGKLQPGKYEIPGNISSQYISALLFALPILEGKSEIVIDGDIESRPYVDLTLQTLDTFGIEMCQGDGYLVTKIKKDDKEPVPLTVFTIRGSQEYKYTDEVKELLEGDWSLGAMWLVASKLLGGTISVSGLNEESNQADAMIQDLLEIDDDLDVIVSIQDCPDLAPAIALWGITRNADTKISDVNRLKLKESDRLKAIVNTLTKLGVDIENQDDRIVIIGNNHQNISGPTETIDSYKDHRIVMLAALVSIITNQPVTIDSPESVNKSYPNFFKEIEKLGGIIEWN